MAINFWEAQRKARSRTTFYLILFTLLTIVVAVIAEIALRAFSQEQYNPDIPLVGLGFLLITFLVAGYNYIMFKQGGGSYVAESVGAYPVDRTSRDFREQQLVNIVEEIAIATSLPTPAIYIIPAKEINAFAAGTNPGNAAIAITEGAIERLTRDELQGVIAHEFGHIHNADMLISMRLAAMVMGFFFVLYIGLRMLQGSGRNNGKGSPVLLAALILMAAGALTWFFGSILKASVSRQREYLADASGVQYTRNPSGLANALRKIAQDNHIDMPKTGGAYSHMYLEDHTSIFATHPPIQQRIDALEGREQ